LIDICLWFYNIIDELMNWWYLWFWWYYWFLTIVVFIAPTYLFWFFCLQIWLESKFRQPPGALIRVYHRAMPFILFFLTIHCFTTYDSPAGLFFFNVGMDFSTLSGYGAIIFTVYQMVNDTSVCVPRWLSLITSKTRASCNFFDCVF
jgi:hypothetical protein